VYLNFVLAALLAASAFAGPALQSPDSSPSRQSVGQAVAGAGVSTVVPNQSAAKPDAGSVKTLDILVPPVKPSDTVVAPSRPLKTQAAPGVVVADRLVAPKRVESEIVKAAGIQMVGVTWPKTAKPGDLGAQVRTRTAGKWSKWVDLKPGDSAPDAGTAEAARVTRMGTDPVSIGNVDDVQLAFTGSAKGGPDGLSLALIGSAAKPVPVSAVGSSAVAQTTSQMFAGVTSRTIAGTSTQTIAGTRTETVAYSSALAAAAVTAPTIITRAQWGAPAQKCAPDVAPALVGAVLHHTAGANDYASVPAAELQIQGDARYHESLGWCDLGYNFVVDKWGNIYEGRANSMTQAVVGAHAGGFNTGTVGIAMLGTFDTAPTAAMQRSVAQIIGWRLGAYGVNPTGSMVYYTGQNEVGALYNNQNVALPRVFAHRDVWATACPGDGGYATLPYVRTTALALKGPLLVGKYTTSTYIASSRVRTAVYINSLVHQYSASTGVISGAGRVSYLQRYNAGAWQNVLARTSNSAGVWTVGFIQAKVFQYRIVTPATALAGGATSASTFR